MFVISSVGKYYVHWVFILGVVAGVKETYAIPYLTDDLGASSQLISVLDLI